MEKDRLLSLILTIENGQLTPAEQKEVGPVLFRLFKALENHCDGIGCTLCLKDYREEPCEFHGIVTT